MKTVVVDNSAPQWAQDLARQINTAFSDRAVPSYSVTKLPSAKTPALLISVPDEVGGHCIAFSDGEKWRRVSDRAIVS